MDKITPVSERMRNDEQEQKEFTAMSCSELLVYLDQHWETLRDERRTFLTSLIVNKKCKEGISYLLHQVKSEDPFSRRQALHGLAELECREHRQLFINLYFSDPDDKVRAGALIDLCRMFPGERDIGILGLALNAFDNPASSMTMRLAAGAAMICQLHVPKELGELPWWDEEEEDLQHPALLRALAESRMILCQNPDHPDAS